MDKKHKTTNREGFANPYVDTQFKLIFDENLTKRFLNSLLKLKSPIVELKLENTESNDLSLYGRRCYFDVLCRDQNGNHFIVEMQRVWLGYLKNRIIYYTCRKIGEMGRRYETAEAEKINSRRPFTSEELKNDAANRWKYDIRSVYSVCLLNSLDKDVEQEGMEQLMIQDVVLYDTANERIYSDKIRIVTVNLKLIDAQKLDVSRDYYENLLILLRKISENSMTIRELIEEIDSSRYDDQTKAEMKRMVNVSNISAMNEEERRRYDEQVMVVMDQLAFAEGSYDDGCRHGRADGFAAGKAEGMKEGMEKGLMDGKNEGLAEGLAKGKTQGKAEGLAEGLAKGKTQGKAEGLAEGLAKGKTQGKAEGLAEGLAKGKSEGRAEGKAEAMLALAQIMKQEGEPIEKIARYTGLDASLIQSL